MKLLTAVLAITLASASTRDDSSRERRRDQDRPPTIEQVTEAVGRVPRFAPDRFPTLPPAARDVFNKISCAVPQMSATGGPQNVIAGEFAAKGQRDWAALCSDGSTTVVRVAWGGPARCEDGVGARQDSESMTQVPPSMFTYDRTISTATTEHIGRALVRFKTTLPEPPAHDAIEDTNRKAPALYYCRGGRWLTVPGR
jgi:hypothetical protein